MSEVEEFIQKLKGERNIVINTCHGGFGLSSAAEKLYLELTGQDEINQYDLDRDDPYLVTVVKDLGMGANGVHANLKIVTIPGDVDWQIQEYDGLEWIAEVHRTWS
jgi:hypothetical protein